jgi:hypothetical protein
MQTYDEEKCGKKNKFFFSFSRFTLFVSSSDEVTSVVEMALTDLLKNYFTPQSFKMKRRGDPVHLNISFENIHLI